MSETKEKLLGRIDLNLIVGLLTFAVAGFVTGIFAHIWSGGCWWTWLLPWNECSPDTTVSAPRAIMFGGVPFAIILAVIIFLIEMWDVLQEVRWKKSLLREPQDQ